MRPIGSRTFNYYKWETEKYAPYNYERNGLLNKIMSNRIINSENESLKIILTYIEDSFIFLMKYVDRLKNFKNIHWKNR